MNNAFVDRAVIELSSFPLNNKRVMTERLAHRMSMFLNGSTQNIKMQPLCIHYSNVLVFQSRIPIVTSYFYGWLIILFLPLSLAALLVYVF